MDEPSIESATTQPTKAAIGAVDHALDDRDAKTSPQADRKDSAPDLEVDRRDCKCVRAGEVEGQPPTGDGIETSDRLHVATLWLPCLEMLFGVLVPVVIATIFIPFGTILFFLTCFVLLPTAAYHVLRYLTLRYEVTSKELVINSGAVFRRERRIPLERVQEVEIRQGFLYRALGLAKLQITTAGSDVQEANLDVLWRRTAECLQERISGYQPKAAGAVPDRATANDYVYRLPLRDLVLGGLTSRLVASLGAVITAIVYFRLFVGIGERWFGKVEQNFDRHTGRHLPAEDMFGSLTDWFESRLPNLGPFNFVVELFFNDTLTKSLLLVLLGLAGSVLAYVIRYYGFRFTRRGNLLTTSYGLLTYRHGSLSRDRIQALKLEESLLRRYFGLASIRVDSAGDRKEIEEHKKRDVLVPVASMMTAQQVAKQAIPGLIDCKPQWQRISPRSVMRGSKKGWLLVLIAMVTTYGMFDWFCLMWLPAIPLVYLLNYQWYRHTGYWLEEDYFLSRKGWLNRETVCLPVRNIQNVSITQSFFDRRVHLATLSIDTAGQSNTGGGPVIRHLSVEIARTLQRTLASRVAARELVW